MKDATGNEKEAEQEEDVVESSNQATGDSSLLGARWAEVGERARPVDKLHERARVTYEVLRICNSSVGLTRIPPLWMS